MATVKHRRSKKNQGLVTKVIAYRDSGCPQRRAREVTIDVRRDPELVMTEPNSDARLCAASATDDLLDCDCGCMTNQMEIQLLTLLDEHTSHSLERQFND